MNDARRAKNCERCRTRQMQEKYMGRVIDYRNCPFVCLQNKVDNVRSGIIKTRPRKILLD